MTDNHKRVGVIGDPVSHSISPAMQQPALDALGVLATYERWHTTAQELKVKVESLRASDVIGANVTVPHKLAVMPYLDEISELANRAGAVNTIINRDGRLFADNTDVYGFATSLISVCPDAGERTSLILGAGGAARAIVLALDSVGVRRILLHNRSRQRAEQFTAEFESITLDLIGDGELPAALAEAGIVINTTALGWHAGETPLALELLDGCRPGTFVADLTYRDTDLLLAARERGLGTLDGLPMLVHQGARALELWTGQKAPVEIMMKAALAARSSR